MKKIIFLSLLIFTIKASLCFAASDWTIVVVPDAQNVSSTNTMNAMFQWIIDNRSTCIPPGCPVSGQWNTQAMIVVGDLSGSGGSGLAMPKVGVDAVKAAGIPVVIAWGNHDRDNESVGSRNITTWDADFGPSYYTGLSYYKGGYPSGSNSNSYHIINVPGQQLLIMSLEFYPRPATNPTAQTATWAAGVLAANIGKQAIIVTHALLTEIGSTHLVLNGDTFGPTANGMDGVNGMNGQQVVDALVKPFNVIATVNGHFFGAPRQAQLTTTRNDGKLAYSFFENYQDVTNQANLLLLKFRPSIGKIEVYDYSTSALAFDTNYPMYQLDWTPPSSGLFPLPSSVGLR